MSIETATKKKRPPTRWRKGWITALVLLLILGGALALTPLLISQQLQRWVLANGGEKVSVEDVDFNPFTAELGLSNILIERSGQRSLLLPELKLKARWKDLFQRRFVIEAVNLDGVQLRFDQSQPEQQHIGGILLKNLLVEESVEPDTEDRPWSFRLMDLQLRDFKLVYQHPDLQSVIDIEALSLANLDTDPLANPAEISLKGSIDTAPVMLEGLLNLFSPEPRFEGRIQLRRLAVNPYLRRVAKELQQNQATVSIDSRLDIRQTADGGLRVEQSGEWGVDELRWRDSALAVDAQQLGWTGELTADISAGNAVQVNTDGRLRGDVLGFDDRKSALSLRDRQLVWEGQTVTELPRAGAMQMKLNGQLRNSQLAVDVPAQSMQLQNGELDWQGSVNLKLAGGDDISVSVQGKLQNGGFALQRATQQLDLGNEQLRWQGRLSMQSTGERLSLESQSNLDLVGVRMQTLDSKERLVLAESVHAKNVAIKSLDVVSLEQLKVSGLSIGKEQSLVEFDQTLPGFANHEALILEQLDYSAETGVHIAKVRLDGLRHALVKTDTGAWGFDSFIQAVAGFADKNDVGAATAGKQATTREVPAEEKLPLKIDSLVIVPGGSLYFVDRSHAEPFAQKIDIDAFRLTNIDSTRPKAGSDLELAAKLADGAIDVKGQVAIFAAQPTFDLEGDVQALSLLPYGLFLKKYLGYEVESGSLNAQTNVSAKEGNLDSTTELALHQLDIRALTEEELKALDGKQNAGLETGLSMLKDKHNTIELSVPVKGPLDNLQVDPGDIINQALGSALKSGAKTYLAAALFPFGTLLVVADAAAGKAMQVKLDPVVFEAGANLLGGDYPAYLEKVAAVLAEKPETHVKVCGVATISDENHLLDQMKQAFLKEREKQAATAGQKAQETAGEAPLFTPDPGLLDKRLKALAVKRADTVIRFLIDKQKTGPKRLINCQPRIDRASPQAKPRVDLLL